MANELTPQQSNHLSRISSRAPSISHAARGIIEYCLSGSVCDGSTNYKIALVNVPSQEQRGALMAQHQELMKALKDHDNKEIGALIAEMLGSYDVARQKYKTQKDKMQVVAKYVQELVGVPTWAVKMACEKIRMGVAPEISHVYEPTTIQVRVLAISIAQPWKTEVRTIGDILTAEKYEEPVNEEARARVGALMRKLADEMKIKQEREYQEQMEKDSPRMKTQTDDFIEREWRGRGEEPVRASNGMLVSRSLTKLIEAQKKAPAGKPQEPMVL